MDMINNPLAHALAIYPGIGLMGLAGILLALLIFLKFLGAPDWFDLTVMALAHGSIGLALILFAQTLLSDAWQKPSSDD